MAVGFDVIGDVHGRLGHLERMLGRLGYRRPADGGAWRHPGGRELVSVGDLLDGGEDPLGCLETVMGMVAGGAGRMVLGNHELNALLWMARLRKKSVKNRGQFGRTLKQIEQSLGRWQRARDFLMRCPTHAVLDGGRLRVVHACWRWQGLEASGLPECIGDVATLRRLADEADPLHALVECCLKAPEEQDEPKTRDAQGVLRRRREPWWQDYPPQEPVVAFGHYKFPWRTKGRPVEQPRLLGRGGNAVCVDFSGNTGKLVALRYPEMELVEVE